MWRLGEVRLFLWTLGRTIRDLGTVGLLVLPAFSWDIQAVDNRYGRVPFSSPICPHIPLPRERS